MPGGMRSRRAGTLVIALCLGLAQALVPRAARGDVDATGSWQLTFAGNPLQEDALFAQSGTNLSVVLDLVDGRAVYSGSIDPGTGSFGVGATLPCPFATPPTPVSLFFSGTVSADGSTLQGTFASQVQVPGNPCSVSVAVSGAHLSTTCGNGTVDAGEACDPGPPPSANLCCTLACATAPSGTACADD